MQGWFPPAFGIAAFSSSQQRFDFSIMFCRFEIFSRAWFPRISLPALTSGTNSGFKKLLQIPGQLSNWAWLLTRMWLSECCWSAQSTAELFLEMGKGKEKTSVLKSLLNRNSWGGFSWSWLEKEWGETGKGVMLLSQTIAWRIPELSGFPSPSIIKKFAHLKMPLWFLIKQQRKRKWGSSHS